MDMNVPVKVQVAMGFIEQMRRRAYPHEEDPLPKMTDWEVKAYNAALFVVYGYFHDEMDYSMPQVPRSPFYSDPLSR